MPNIMNVSSNSARLKIAGLLFFLLLLVACGGNSQTASDGPSIAVDFTVDYPSYTRGELTITAALHDYEIEDFGDNVVVTIEVEPNVDWPPQDTMGPWTFYYDTHWIGREFTIPASSVSGEYKETVPAFIDVGDWTEMCPFHNIIVTVRDRGVAQGIASKPCPVNASGGLTGITGNVALESSESSAEQDASAIATPTDTPTVTPPIPTENSSSTSNCVRLENEASAQFFSEKCFLDSGPGSRSVFAADLDNDGDIDLLSAVADSIIWLENTGGEPLRHVIANGLSTPQSAAAADFDQDGDLDVIGAGDWGVAWWENDGSGEFVERNELTDDSINSRTAIIADLDSNGLIDIVVAEWETDRVISWINEGRGNFTQHLIDDGFVAPNHLESTDVDNDGDQDILGAGGYNSSSGMVAWWENDGSGTFTRHDIDNSGANHAILVDINGDGRRDIVATLLSGQVVWWAIDGTNFGEKNILHEDMEANYILVGDVNADGIEDLIMSSYCGYYFWQGGAGWGEPNFWGCSERPGDLLFLDFDGDGDLDLFVAGRGSGTGGLVWFRR